MKREMMVFNGEALPLVERRFIERRVEQVAGPQIPFHNLIEAPRKIEHTPEGPRMIAAGKPMKLDEYQRAKMENPNKVLYGKTVSPEFVYQLICTFAAFKFTSAPWGAGEQISLENLAEAEIVESNTLVFSDGNKIPGMLEKLTAGERTANELQLAREDRESGVSFDLEKMAAKVDATNKSVERLAGVVPDLCAYFEAAVDDSLSFNIEMGKQFPLSDKEKIVLEAVQAVGGDTMKASRALITKYGKGKGYSQGNIWKIVADVNTRIKAKRGQGAFDSHEPKRYPHAPEGTERR